MNACLIEKSKSPRKVAVVPKAEWDAWLADRHPAVRSLAANTAFEVEPGAVLPLPVDAKDDPVAAVIVGAPISLWDFGALALGLPEGDYTLSWDALPDGAGEAEMEKAALGWALGGYQFTRYRAAKRKPARLATGRSAAAKSARRLADATWLVRDLINTPAADMGPGELAKAVEEVGATQGAAVTVTTGKDLLKRNYPAIHAVGRASEREPRLIDLSWTAKGAKKSAPLLVIVGKGVCFDSGGLDLKPSSAMLLMKKDMGGAAHALALAQMVMDAALPVRLRLLIPAVENSVSGNAFRPLDVLSTRKGLTVEVGNTDAEGRLILCDALAEGDSEKPDLMIDFATLTGAARVALGPDLPALFCNDDGVAQAFQASGDRTEDPVWRLPLHKPYRRLLDSKVADMNNVSSGPFAGAITAALFLEAFVSDTTPWVHIDVMAWNTAAKRGRPEGGEAMSLRAAFALLCERYGTRTDR